MTKETFANTPKTGPAILKRAGTRCAAPVRYWTVPGARRAARRLNSPRHRPRNLISRSLSGSIRGWSILNRGIGSARLEGARTITMDVRSVSVAFRRLRSVAATLGYREGGGRSHGRTNYRAPSELGDRFGSLSGALPLPVGHASAQAIILRPFRPAGFTRKSSAYAFAWLPVAASFGRLPVGDPWLIRCEATAGMPAAANFGGYNCACLRVFGNFFYFGDPQINDDEAENDRRRKVLLAKGEVTPCNAF